MQTVSRVKDLAGDVRGRGDKMSGLWLVETMIVVFLIMIANGIFFMSLQPDRACRA